jgi:hypothetical protein
MQSQAAPGFANEAGARIWRPRRAKPDQRAKEVRRRIQIMRNQGDVMDGPGHKGRSSKAISGSIPQRIIPGNRVARAPTSPATKPRFAALREDFSHSALFPCPGKFFPG